MLYNILKQLLNSEDIARLLHYFINLARPSFAYEFLFSVACTGDNHGLIKTFSSYELPHFLRCFKSIHNRHRQIHKNQAIWKVFVLKCFFNFFYRLKTVVCCINWILYGWVTRFLQNDLKGNNIVRFVIYNQDSSVLSHFLYLQTKKVFLNEWLWFKLIQITVFVLIDIIFLYL